MLRAGLSGRAHQLRLGHVSSAVRRHRLRRGHVAGEELRHMGGGEGRGWRHQQRGKSPELTKVIESLVRGIEYPSGREVVWAHDGEGSGMWRRRGEGGCLRKALGDGGGWG